MAGTWRAVGARIEILPFEPLPGAARHELEADAAALAAFHAA